VTAARRRFLQASGGLVLACASGLAGALFDGEAADAGRSSDQGLSELFRSPRKARALGERYLALHPEAAGRAALAARLGLDAAPISRASLRERLASLRERDFAQRRIVAIDGWILARSEAEICALLSLG
jgi:hypothetical protein